MSQELGVGGARICMYAEESENHRSFLISAGNSAAWCCLAAHHSIVSHGCVHIWWAARPRCMRFYHCVFATNSKLTCMGFCFCSSNFLLPAFTDGHTSQPLSAAVAHGTNLLFHMCVTMTFATYAAQVSIFLLSFCTAPLSLSPPLHFAHT